MKKEIQKIILLGNLILLIGGCDRPECENHNRILAEYEIESNEYKVELWNEIETIGAENLRYWFDKHEEEKNKDFIVVHIQNDSLCAKGKILVNDWGKLKNLKSAKGDGYRGAELEGLRFELETKNDNSELVFQEVRRIID